MDALGGFPPSVRWSAEELRFAALALCALFLAGIAWTDLRRWEIDPRFCAAAALAGSVWITVDGSWPSSLLGAAAGLGFALAAGTVRRSALGEGDYMLYALCGFLVGAGGLLGWALVNAALTLACAFCMARRRKRKIRRVAVPAALPACPAAALFLPV